MFNFNVASKSIDFFNILTTIYYRNPVLLRLNSISDTLCASLINDQISIKRFENVLSRCHVPRSQGCGIYRGVMDLSCRFLSI